MNKLSVPACGAFLLALLGCTSTPVDESDREGDPKNQANLGPSVEPSALDEPVEDDLPPRGLGALEISPDT